MPASGGACSKRARRACSIALICSRSKASRVRSRRISSSVFGGIGVFLVRRNASSCGALRSSGLKPRTPSRARAAFMRLMMRVRSPTRVSRSRLGRLASSSSIVGIATIPQWPRSPRNHPRNTRISMAVSSRSVLARLCSRETATLLEWMTWVSIHGPVSHRASQNPSRPDSKARTVRVIALPAFVARSRQPSTNAKVQLDRDPVSSVVAVQFQEQRQQPASSINSTRLRSPTC